MAENYKQLYEQMKKLVALYQDEVVPELREQLENRVEVVRCKDCKHGIWSEYDGMWMCVESAEYDAEYDVYGGFVSYNQAEHFCYYGERREGE